MYQLYGKREYLAELSRRFEVCRRGNRILLISMWLDPDEPEVAEMLSSLEQAAKLGADIILGIDARSFMASNGKPDPGRFRTSLFGPLLVRSDLPAAAELRPPYQIRKAALERLAGYPNVKVNIINKPRHRMSLAIAGRSHIKTAVIDDYVLLGGCNLDYPSYPDLMVGWRDRRAANELYELLSDAVLSGNIHRALKGWDRSIKVGKSSRILIDAGIRNQSLIYDEALRLIDDAQEWLVLTCQFFPNSRTANHLRAAMKRGVDVQILFAHYSTHGVRDGTIQLVNQAIERARLPREMFAHSLPRTTPKVHAKLIASDAGAMIGSHNYVTAGVRLGTAEIALKSNDKKLAKAARQKIYDQLPE